MDAKLVVVGADCEASDVDLDLPATIGRGRDTAVMLPHPLVSRQHCELYEAGGRLFVRDLGSLNGTYVNNERIQTERELPPGDLLTVGTVTFRAVYESSQSAAATVGGQHDNTASDGRQAIKAEPTAATVKVREQLEKSGQRIATGDTDQLADDTAQIPPIDDDTDHADTDALSA